MRKLLDKYPEIDGAQDVIWLSPLKFVEAAGLSLELTSQNTGAIARQSGAQRHRTHSHLFGALLTASRLKRRSSADSTTCHQSFVLRDALTMVVAKY